MDAAGPGPGVFRNLEPISREDRSATRNKDVLEKNRLAARQQAPLTSAQSHLKLPPVVNPIQPIKQSSLYIEEYDRFNRDVAGELYRSKMAALQRKEENYERKRSEQYHREKSKWDRLDAAHNKDEQRMAHLRDAGIGARRNQSSAAFNILTLQYDKSPKGQALAARDEASKARSQLRAINLYTKNHSVSHDIINHRQLSSINPSSYQTVAPWDK